MSDSTVYRHRDFLFFAIARFLGTTAMMVQSVAIGWQIYDMERTPLALGLVGLCQFVPMFLFTLPAGEMSDRFDQRKLLAIAQVMMGLCSGLFLVLSIFAVKSALAYYAVLVLFGVGRGFASPSGQSLLPFLVPPERLPRAIALNSSVFMVAVIAGPALGGFLYVFGPEVTYSLCMANLLVCAVLIAVLGGRRKPPHSDTEMSRLDRVKEGIRFVRNRPVIFGAISLDLFAVLLGGATALLPIYARDILHSTPVGLGLLRSAPAVGAAVVALMLARWPVERQIGVKMFGAVAVFGVATIVFGVSTDFWLSMGALFVLGASDMISVFVRQSLVTFATPDDMRGRVGAVNMLFIGASNELGEFESGITAALFGPVLAVVVGGLGTLAVVGTWMKLFPPLRTVDRLKDVKVEQA
ncbi:MFS transporter [Rhizomicrobium electricum]|uniref:MFS transporter n=1 Tax=Rhizomicrobium electricum TaxID=480070 RepID=A0ABN1EWS9_9PROT|nr:MFS transporter [Rhizomicrobium electricum]NIJ49980.1 MFS family permease [Rhizomicrobium electricum]